MLRRNLSLFHRSTELMSLHFLFGGFVKCGVYKTAGHVDSVKTLKLEAAAAPEMFERALIPISATL
jgi:hypothetical protein